MVSPTDAVGVLDPEKIAKTANEATEAAQRLIAIARELKGSIAFLKSMPSIALIKINKILDEVGKTVDAVQTAGAVFLELILDPAKVGKDPKVLIDLASTKLQAMVEEKRGHCSTIWAIRQDYLQGWLDQFAITQAQKEAQIKKVDKINEIFSELSNADDDIFMKLADFAAYLQAMGQRALLHSLANEPEKARQVLRETTIRVLEFQTTLGEVQREMLNVRRSFIEAMSLSEAGRA